MIATDYIFGRKRNEEIIASGLTFNTLSSETPNKAAFIIQREIDSVIETFTYSQIINGTYASFISGTNGKIIEWIGEEGKLISKNEGFILNPLPFVDSAAITGKLFANHNLNLEGDWILTTVQNWKVNLLSGNISWMIRGLGEKSLTINLSSSAVYIVLDRLSSGTPTHEYSHTSNATHRLYTFSKIAGVFQCRVNNVLKSLVLNPTQSWKQLNPGTPPEKYLNLGGTFGLNNGGIRSDYKHFKVIEGVQATTTDLSAYNQAIMTKYGI